MRLFVFTMMWVVLFFIDIVVMLWFSFLAFLFVRFHILKCS